MSIITLSFISVFIYAVLSLMRQGVLRREKTNNGNILMQSLWLRKCSCTAKLNLFMLEQENFFAG